VVVRVDEVLRQGVAPAVAKHSWCARACPYERDGRREVEREVRGEARECRKRDKMGRERGDKVLVRHRGVRQTAGRLYIHRSGVS
jgi:hypothetical protein